MTTKLDDGQRLLKVEDLVERPERFACEPTVQISARIPEDVGNPEAVPDPSWELGRLGIYARSELTKSDQAEREALLQSRKSAVHLLRAGRALAMAQEKCKADGHGVWARWKREHLLADTTANDAIRLFKRAKTEEAVAGMGVTESKERYVYPTKDQERPTRSAKPEEVTATGKMRKGAARPSNTRGRRGKKPGGVPGAVAALIRLVAEGQVDRRDAVWVAGALNKAAQRELVKGGPAAVADKARDLQWLSRIHVYEVRSNDFDPTVEVSDDARRQAERRWQEELDKLRRSCQTVGGWIADLQAKLQAGEGLPVGEDHSDTSAPNPGCDGPHQADGQDQAQLRGLAPTNEDDRACSQGGPKSVFRERPSFPYFGGKYSIAGEVWTRLGDVEYYLEPFAGSAAVLLARPGQPRDEILGDKCRFVSNFWRAAKWKHAEVAQHAHCPPSQIDLYARHRWIMRRAAELDLDARLRDDPEWCDPQLAAWWAWGLCLWSWPGWCRRQQVTWRRPSVQRGQGLLRKCTVVADYLANLIRRVESGGPSRWEEDLVSYLRALAHRLERVTLHHDDWRACVTPATLRRGADRGHSTGIVLDPPYDQALRDPSIYLQDRPGLSQEVWRWAVEHGDDRRLRIALCGLEGEHRMPSGWDVVAWRKRERIWFSPHCLRVQTQRRAS